MAAIGSIRKHSTILLVVVALALSAFLLGDLSRSQTRNGEYMKFITVGDESVTYDNYMRKYEELRERQKANYGMDNLPPDADFQIGLSTYEIMVDSILLAKQANYLGITVTDDELYDLVAGEYPHQLAQQFFAPQGVYDRQLAQQFLANMEPFDTNAIKQYLNYVEPTIEKDAFQNKYMNLLTGAYYLPKAFVQKIVDEASLKANIELVQIPYSTPLVNDDSVSSEELKKCYEENKYRFKQDEEMRDVEYVIFPIEPSENDLQEIAGNVHKMYEEFTQAERPDHFVNRLVDSRYDSTFFKRGFLEPGIDTALFEAPVGTFVEPFVDGIYWKFAKLLSAQNRPDSINISFIALFHRDQEGKALNKEEIDKKADTAFRMAMSGMDFYELTKQYSVIPVEQQPDQGRYWIEDGIPDIGFQTFFDSLHMLPPGSIRKIEIERFGATYVFRVNERTEVNRKIRVAIGRKEILASKETVSNIESNANNFANGTIDYELFKKAVEKYRVDPRTNDRVTKMTYTLPGVPNGGRNIIKWVYGEKTEKGMVSPVFSLDGMYVVAVLKDIYPEGYRPLEQEQVRNQIEAIAKRDKKAKKLEELINKSLASGLMTVATNNNAQLDTITVIFGDRNFGHYGPEAKVIGKLFAQAAESTVVIKGDMGVYVIKINNFETPSLDVSASSQTNIDMVIQQNRMMNQNRVNNLGLRPLRKLYEIKDNRILTM